MGSSDDGKRNHSVVRRLLNEAGNSTIVTPIVMSACGMGPSMVAFLKEVYGRAKEADKFLMSRQPALKHSWNTMVASSFWDMRLSITCAATDAEYQNLCHSPGVQELGSSMKPLAQLAS